MDIQQLKIQKLTLLEKCKQLISNEKLSFFKDFGFKLTDKMISDCTGINYHSLKHLEKFNTDTLTKYRKILQKTDFVKWVYKILLKKKI